MGIFVPPAPPDGLDLVRGNLRTLLRHDTNVRARLRRSHIPTVSAVAPHRSYHLEPSALADLPIRSAAKMTSWRYLLFDGRNPLLTVAISSNESGQSTDFLGANESSLLQAFVNGVKFAEQHELIREADYELRLLEVPSIYLSAIWLHSENDIYFSLSALSPEGPFLAARDEELARRIREEVQSRGQEDVM